MFIFSYLIFFYLISVQSNAAVSKEKSDVEAVKVAAESQAGRLSQEVERLRRRVQELENEVAKLNHVIHEAKLQESKLEEKARRLEVGVTHQTTDIRNNWTD